MISIAICGSSLSEPSPCGTKTLLRELVRRWADARDPGADVTIVVPTTSAAQRLSEELPPGCWRAVVLPRSSRWTQLIKWLIGMGSVSAAIGRHDVYISGWHWPLGRSDRPFVGIVHDLVPLFESTKRDRRRRSLKRLLYSWLYYHSIQSCCRRAAAIISISADTRAKLEGVRHGAPMPPHYTILHGTDAAWWALRPSDGEVRHVLQEYGLSSGPPYVLALGQHVHRKNFRTLIRAFQIIALQRRHVRLVIAGGFGECTDELRNIARTLDIEPRLKMVGFVPDNSLRILMQNASIFACPSLEEGFGLPLLEAFASGTPVVCSDRGALPEVAADAAVVVDATDPAAWADAISRLLDDLELRELLKLRGLTRLEYMSWDACATRYLEIFERVACDGADLERSPSSLAALGHPSALLAESPAVGARPRKVGES